MHPKTNVEIETHASLTRTEAIKKIFVSSHEDDSEKVWLIIGNSQVCVISRDLIQALEACHWDKYVHGGK